MVNERIMNKVFMFYLDSRIAEKDYCFYGNERGYQVNHESLKKPGLIS